MALIHIEQDDLNRWRQSYEVLRAALWEMSLTLHTGNVERAKELAEQIHAGAEYISLQLTEAGAEPPILPTDTPPSLLGSEANRNYAETLRTAYESAVTVDKERDVYPEGRSAILEAMLREVEAEIQNARLWADAQSHPNDDA